MANAIPGPSSSPQSEKQRPPPITSRIPTCPSPRSILPPPRRTRCSSSRFKPWIPLILYALTSLAFVFAISLWRTEVFARLDELSHWLRQDEQFGYAMLFFLILLTTIPPVPLYSTLIVLSGYTFGPWTGAVLSYLAALTGALFVFTLSRALLRDNITRWLACTPTIKRVVRAIEKRPSLLFLIRLAPYPYNVMNCILAASPTLKLRTFTLCTALSLFKVIIHTTLGASIHSFKDYHSKPGQAEEISSADTTARIWTVIGIVLCILILVYLSVVARRAVEEELDNEGDEEECVGFLDVEAGHPASVMVECTLRRGELLPLGAENTAP